jgi:hypothetical protein
MEVVVLMVLALLAGVGILGYHDNTKLILIAGIARTARCRSPRARIVRRALDIIGLASSNDIAPAAAPAGLRWYLWSASSSP